ncbi:glycosyltransferase family 39 protein [Gelria sp. Kuro-4]|uniref:ArnT family glycosyltransferase n=1 Tax=Gelria sp. Kuro-4 TaxID=2796927 RepID=UPI001BF01E94|nr:glycosyltransferase family 39 protein [Gelria sp. Kuro-4]BCV24049.1 hypothetical protein kuro4_08220 [Gelria sp. Kuro-4]
MERRTWWRDAALVFAAALALRLLFNWGFVTNKAHPDIASMYQYSLRVAQGIYYGAGAYWPPGFIFLSGGLIRLFGPEGYWTAVRYLQALLGAATCALGCAIGRAAFGSRSAGLLGGLGLAVYLPLIYYTGLAFSETLFLFFLMAAVYYLYRLARTQAVRDAAAAGFLLGLATLTRPVSLLVPVLVLPWYWLLWGRRLRPVLGRVLLMGAVLLLTLLPWVVRNYIVTGDLVLVDVNGGINFYIGHNERANGTWVDMGQKTDAVIILGGSPEGGRLGYRRGLEFIRTHPRRELELAWTKFKWFWTKPSDWYITRYARERGLPHLEPPVWGALAVAGAILTRRRWRGTLFLVLFILYYNAIIVAIYYASRYRLVVEPFWVLLTAGGAAEVLLRLRRVLES